MASSAVAAETFAGLKAGLDVRAAGRVVQGGADAVSSGFPELDRALAGGFIRGSIASLEGPPSSGRTALLACALARATAEGVLAALIDDGSLYPPDLARAGVDLERVLIACAGPASVARSADILLRSHAFGMLAVPTQPWRATVWSRLHTLAQKSGAVVFTIGTQARTELGYFASTRIRCGIERVQWAGSGVFGELKGYDVCAHVIKHRRGAPGAAAHLRIAQEETPS